MGCWDVWCPLCGLPFGIISDLINNNIIIDKDLLKILKKIKWIEKSTILLSNEKVKHGYKEFSCNIYFCNKKNECYSIKNPKDGIVLHTDCWKFAKSKNIILNYTNFNITKADIKKKMWKQYKFKYLNYKPANLYHSQDFQFKKLEKNKKHWYILFSPISKLPKSKLNAKRIMININKIKKMNKSKINRSKTKNRPSPSVSATLYIVGTKKKGNDGNIYIVKQITNGSKRWYKYKK